MNLIKKYHLIFLFLVTITLPVINYNNKIWKFERKDENRSFKNKLQINIKKLDKFPKEAEEYVNDNFSFRGPLLNLYHYFKFYYFKVSPHPDKTIIGLENWYFLAEKEKDIYEGKLSFSNEELNLFKQEWIARKKYLDSLNIKSYWIIAPFKHNIYSEFLPFNVGEHKVNRIDVLKKYLQDSLPELIIDPTEEFLLTKKNYKLYNQLDNHWNLTAGYVVSKILLSKIKTDFPNKKIMDVPTYQWKDSILHQGIHYNVLGIKDLYEVESFPIINKEFSVVAEKYNFPPVKDFPYPWDYERRYVNYTDTNGLKILFIMDSFGDRLIPFIKESFKESVFIFDAWQYNINKPIIETVKPDIVIFLCLETHIDNILTHR